MRKRVKIWYSWGPICPGWVTHKQKIKYNCRNSPQRARLPSYIGLPSLGILLWKDELPKCIVFEGQSGLIWGNTKELAWEIKFPFLKGMHKMSQAWGLREEAAVWKESESDPYTDLGDPAGEITLVFSLQSSSTLFPSSRVMKILAFLTYFSLVLLSVWF